MIRVFAMSVASVDPHYVNKVAKKGRTVAELDMLVDELAKGRPMDKVLRS